MPLDNFKPVMPDKVSFDQIVKSPMVWALITITSLLWIAVSMFWQSNNNNLKAREEDLKGCRIEVMQLKKENQDIFKALLQKQGIILEVESKLDSIK